MVGPEDAQWVPFSHARDLDPGMADVSYQKQGAQSWQAKWGMLAPSE
jgi:hypothetical protein